MTTIDLSFPDEDYSTSNEPEADVLKADLTKLEGEANSKDSRISALESAPAPTATAPVPAGAVIEFAGAVAPTNYLLCNHQEVSRTTFATLFARIGIIYGAGDGSTTFNVPDRADVAPVGVGELALGATTGNKEITIAEDQMPKHKHDTAVDSVASVSDPGHPHTGSYQTDGSNSPVGGNRNIVTDDRENTGTGNKITMADNTTGISVSVANTVTEAEKGNNQSINIEGRRVGTNFIIKANDK